MEKCIQDWGDKTDAFCLIWTFLSQCDGKDLLERWLLTHGKVQSSSSWDLTSRTKASLALCWTRPLGCSIRYWQTGTGTPVWKYCSVYSGAEKSSGYCMQLWEVTVKRLSTYFLKFKKPCCMYSFCGISVADGSEPAYQILPVLTKSLHWSNCSTYVVLKPWWKIAKVGLYKTAGTACPRNFDNVLCFSPAPESFGESPWAGCHF